MRSEPGTDAPLVASRSDRSFWLVVFAPPVAWTIDELTSIALHYDYCAALVGRAFRAWSGVGVALSLVGLLMLGVALWSGLTAWRLHLSLGSDTGEGDTMLDRRRFMARAGLLVAALFSFGIVLRLVAPWVLSPDLCGS